MGSAGTHRKGYGAQGPNNPSLNKPPEYSSLNKPPGAPGPGVSPSTIGRRSTSTDNKFQEQGKAARSDRMGSSVGQDLKGETLLT